MTPSSLFDVPPADPVTSSLDWLANTLLGDLAVGLCVIAVAMVGFTMLTGRMPIRRGMHVIMGCFVLLGAPAIAESFSGVWQERAGAPLAMAPGQPTVIYEREELPPADYNPYARASLRRD